MLLPPAHMRRLGCRCHFYANWSSRRDDTIRPTTYNLPIWSLGRLFCSIEGERSLLKREERKGGGSYPSHETKDVGRCDWVVRENKVSQGSKTGNWSTHNDNSSNNWSDYWWSCSSLLVWGFFFSILFYLQTFRGSSSSQKKECSVIKSCGLKNIWLGLFCLPEDPDWPNFDSRPEEFGAQESGAVQWMPLVR